MFGIKIVAFFLVQIPNIMRQPKTLPMLIAFAAIISLSACSSLRTAFDYDKQADFSRYKTFAFYKEGMDQLKVNDIDKKRFIQAVVNDLQSKQLTKSTENPDLLVNIIITGKDRMSITDDYPYGYGWWYPMPSMTVRQYTESTIYIDLIDREKNQLVWQGKGTDEFNASESDRDTRIQETVTKILAQYPYGERR